MSILVGLTAKSSCLRVASREYFRVGRIAYITFYLHFFVITKTQNEHFACHEYLLYMYFRCKNKFIILVMMVSYAAPTRLSRLLKDRNIFIRRRTPTRHVETPILGEV